MIKRTLAVLLFALICVKGYSQTKFTPEWNFGANFGVNLSNMSFVTTDPSQGVDTKMLQQYKGGVSARYISEKNLGFIAELNYSQQGYEQKFPVENTDSSRFTQKLAYIQIPFLTHIYFGDKKRVFINLGPQISFLVGEQKTRDLSTSDYDESKAWEHYNQKVQNKFDYGLVFGLGFELRTGAGNFALEGRYYMGFSDIYSSHKTDPFSRSANRVISIAATYYMKPF